MTYYNLVRITNDSEITAIVNNAHKDVRSVGACTFMRSGYARKTVVPTQYLWARRLNQVAGSRLFLVTTPYDKIPKLDLRGHSYQTLVSNEFAGEAEVALWDLQRQFQKVVQLGNTLIEERKAFEQNKAEVLSSQFAQLVNNAENEVLKHVHDPLLGDLSFSYANGISGTFVAGNKVNLGIGQQNITFNGSFFASYKTNVYTPIYNAGYSMIDGATFMNTNTWFNFLNETSIKALISASLELSGYNPRGVTISPDTQAGDPAFINASGALRAWFGTIYIVDDRTYGSDATGDSADRATNLLPDNKIVCIGGANTTPALECLVGPTELNEGGVSFQTTPQGYSTHFYENVGVAGQDPKTPLFSRWTLRAKMGVLCEAPGRIKCITTV